MKKRIQAALIVLLLVICASFSIAQAETFEGKAQGFGGDVTVTIDVNDGKITGCNIRGDHESTGIGSLAVENFPAQIIEKNGENLDAQSGATVTSGAILRALENALVSAGMHESGTSGKYTPGEYEATAAGRNGPLTLKTVFDENQLTDIEIVSHTETRGVYEVAFERILPQIIEGQTLNVDTVTAATVTRNAVLTAVADCIQQAGGDPNTFYESQIEHEEIVPEPQTLEADILVVGGGLSGLSTAVSARDRGANVILLEKAAYVGGNSLTASGIFTFGGGTDIQIENGIEDTPELFEQALHDAAAAQGGSRDPVQVHLMAEYANEALRFLVENGTRFQETVAFSMGSATIQRAHRANPDGSEAVLPLYESALKKGVTIMLDTAATELLTDENGNVIGVSAVGKAGEQYTILAPNTVLATGGYRASNELTKKYLGEKFDGLIYCGMPGSTGEMTEAAIALGAETYQIDQPYLSPTYTKNRNAITSNMLSKGGILVNSKAMRYCDENNSYRRVAENTLALGEKDNIVYEIFDENVRNAERQADMYINRGLTVKCDTIEELAELKGLDPETLRKTVDTYVAVANGEIEDEFGRSIRMPGALSQPPYYCIEVTPGGIISGGGLKVNEHFQIVKTDGTTIGNLYGVGEIVGGMRAYGYAGGDSLGHCVISGLIVGRELTE